SNRPGGGGAADFEVVDDEVAVAPTGGVLGIVVIVQIGSGELVFAGAKGQAHLVNLRTAAHYENVEAADFLVVEQEGHASRFGAGLLAVSARTQGVFTVG